ncbi:MAG: HNH endonuclease [Deltaproteobacteria bacterium]|nr:HNH endonuclease [Deltaproteobacteria bacterium]
MPVDWSKYPDDWPEISLAVKEEADWQCEMCGKQCRLPGEMFDTHKRTLTVAHCNHRPMDCRPENLCAACAPCHLRYDAKHHALTRWKKRNKNQLCLF